MVRVEKLREGLEPQPLAKLMAVEPSLRDKASRLRRILCSKVFKGDDYLVAMMERVKVRLLAAQNG
jgi:hypothetical protein